MEITAHYLDERNAITEPDKMVFVSQYFRRHWMPRLGPLGTVIVIYLRGACYHNRRSGETRDTVQLPQRQIAAGCGCSVATLKRELEKNEALRRFVHVAHEWERDGATGRVRQVENHYKVAMDDPLTEADELRLRERLARRAAREPDVEDPPRKPIRVKAPTFSDAVPTACSRSVNDAVSDAVLQCQRPKAHSELLRPKAHSGLTPVQNELPKKRLLPETTSEKTLNVREGDGYRSAYECVERVVTLTGDTKSLRRFEQLFEIARDSGWASAWDEAERSLRNRLARETLGPLEKPGAYFCKALAEILTKRGVTVPVGSAQQREAVRDEIAHSLGLCAGTEEEGRDAQGQRRR